MPTGPRPIARIALARSRPRLLAVPAVLVLAGAAAIGVGWVTVSGPIGVVLAGLGALVVVGALIGAILLLSVRFEVAESSVSVTWFGGRRFYALVPGPVTRVQLRGKRASRLRPRSGALGWGIGAARLRGEEEIELVRLAPTATAILVPTDRGRLAVAPAVEQDLLEALAQAAQARQRAEVAGREVAEPEAEPEAEEPEVEPGAEVEAEPNALTGIERALLEERLAREREDARRVTAAAQTAAAAAVPEADETAVSSPPAPRRRPALGLARPGAGAVFVLLPTAAAGLTWWIGLLAGVVPDTGTDLARLTSLGLVLAGPATSVAAIMTLAWWPRLVGVVVTAGLVATIFIGRSFIG